MAADPPDPNNFHLSTGLRHHVKIDSDEGEASITEIENAQI